MAQQPANDFKAEPSGDQMRGVGVPIVVAPIAKAAGLKVVMNRCPKIELFRPFWKPRLNQAI